MRQAMDFISLIGMAQSIQRCGHMRSECKLGAHAGSRPRVTSMGGLYDAATLHAACQVYPFPSTWTGSFLNDFKIIVHDHGELHADAPAEAERIWAGRDSRAPRTPDASSAEAMRPDGQKDADVRRSSLGRDKPNVDTPVYALQQGVMPPLSALIRQCLAVSRSAQHVCTPNASPCVGAPNAANLNWPRGVTASILDSESSDRGANPREALCQYRADLTSLGPCTTHAAALLTHRLRMFTGAPQIWQEHVLEKEACEVGEKSISI
jgi:hypothetical protein